MALGTAVLRRTLDPLPEGSTPSAPRRRRRSGNRPSCLPKKDGRNPPADAHGRNWCYGETVITGACHASVQSSTLCSTVKQTGRLTEWPMVPASKTGVAKASGGSNPSPSVYGKMSERSMVRAWRARGVKASAGSNPALSVIERWPRGRWQPA